MSARQSKNRLLIGAIWNVISPSDMSKLTDPINIALQILNIKLANPALFLSS